MRRMMVKISLSRSLLTIMLVTYLPTALMNIINQATNYIQVEGKYELVITVNITCMMVLASVYLSVSASLPSTQSIKPVEIWLLVNLSYPFFVIIANIVKQVIFCTLPGLLTSSSPSFLSLPKSLSTETCPGNKADKSSIEIQDKDKS